MSGDSRLFLLASDQPNLPSNIINILVISDFFKDLEYRERTLRVQAIWGSREFRINPICLTFEEFKKGAKKIKEIKKIFSNLIEITPQ